ncbi:MAG: class I mannose-6-phosphate isomerase, partial [Dongiaceae bacterium]
YEAPGFPLLAKFLFTSAKLSVQVHPDDEFARAREGGCGKTEMWYVLRAEPGAAVALGLIDTLTPDELRAAALSGEIEHRLNWTPVRAGDAVLVPAGTLHTIGPGLALCEIQQHSDLTYRFYDFGRGRELHIERAVAAVRLAPHPGPLQPDGNTLVACEHFVVERRRAFSPLSRSHLLLFLEGRGTLASEPYGPGDVFFCGGDAVWQPAEGTLVLRAWTP